MKTCCRRCVPGHKRTRSYYNFLKGFALVACQGFLAFSAIAQTDIPLGTWRLHLSYNNIRHVAPGIDEVYAATESGLLVFHRADNSLTTVNTLNGLSGTGITALAFDAASHQVLIGYEDSNLDVIHSDNTVTHFDRLKNSQAVTGTRSINDILVRDHLAYLSTDYGVVVFDLAKTELKETWRDLGTGGKPLRIFHSTLLGDSIFLATEKGIIAGDLNTNLLDFEKWKRFDAGTLSSTVSGIATFNNTVYAAVDGQGVYHYQSGKWIRDVFLQGLTFSSLSASANHLVIGENKSIHTLSLSGKLDTVVSDKIASPTGAVEDDQQKLWIADQQNGLLAGSGGSFEAYLPNGPASTSASRLVYHNGTLYALSGGLASSGLPLGNAGIVDQFSDGAWSTLQVAPTDITDIDFIGQDLYLASFGGGVEKIDAAGTVTDFNASNSTLKKSTPSSNAVYVSTLERSPDGLWVVNYATLPGLHLLKDNAWQSFSLASSPGAYATNMVIDFSGNVWLMVNPAQGGGVVVFNPQNQTSVYKTSATGAGGLPSQNVNAMAMDRDGYVWVGTDQGVAYFFSPGSDAVKPIFENRFLLRDEKITAIAIDGGNRKWIGTQRGVWLFNPTGETLVQNFTVGNSPLLSNVIRDIGIQQTSGEVFFSTDEGIVSYRSDATAGAETFGTIRIFPNPVTASFTGTVGITGLATDAIVKITDVSGKLIWETQANGGAASWNVRDYNGRRASTGVYLVFAATADGSEHSVGKIVVID